MSEQLNNNNLPEKDPTLPYGIKPYPLTKKPSFVGSSPYNNRGMNISDAGRSINSEENFESALAENQSGWELAGKFLTRAAGEAVFGTLEGASYLADLEQHVNVLKGSEQEYSNWFADAMKAAKEKVNEDIAPVYRSQEAQGDFKLSNFLDGTFWVDNAPSIASTVSLMVPAWGAAKAASMAGKGIRGLMVANAGMEGNAFSTLAKQAVFSKKWGDAGNALSAATASRYMENTMEASQAFESTYAEAIAKGMSDAQAKKAAGDAAAGTFKMNLALGAIDYMQHLSMLKGPISVGNKLFLKNKLAKGVTNIVGSGMIGEGLEEGYQFVAQEESKRKALGELGDLGLAERLTEYLKDPEMQKSMALGAVGGTVMSGFNEATSFADRVLGRQSDVEKMLAKIREDNKGNIQDARNLQSSLFVNSFYNHISSGKIEDFELMHDAISSMSDEELRSQFKGSKEEVDQQIKDFRDNSVKFKEDIAYLKQEYDSISDDLSLDPKMAIKKFETRYAQRVNSRSREEIDSKINDIRNSVSSEASTLELDLSEATHEKRVLEQQKKSLSEKYSDKIDTSILDKAIDDRIKELDTKISSLKEQGVKEKETSKSHKLRELVNQKVINTLTDVNLQNRLKKFTTKAGQNALSQELNTLQEIAVIDSIKSPKATVSSINAALNNSNNTSRENIQKELDNEYSLRVSSLPKNKSNDHTVRYSDPIILRKEMMDISNMFGIDTSKIDTLADFIKQRDENKEFADAVDSYLASQNPIVLTPVEEGIPAEPLDEVDDIIINDDYITLDTLGFLPDAYEDFLDENEKRDNVRFIKEKVESIKKRLNIINNNISTEEDRLTFINQLLDETVAASDVKSKNLVKQIEVLNSIIKSKSSKLTKRGLSTEESIKELKELIRSEYKVANDIFNRARELSLEKDRLIAISKHLNKQISYYNNLIQRKDFKTFSIQELKGEISRIQKKISKIEKLIDAITKAIKQSIEYLKFYVKNTISKINKYESFKKESGFENLDSKDLADLIKKGEADNYSSFKQINDSFQSQVEESISDVEMLEQIKENEIERLNQLEKKLQNYKDNVDFLVELISDMKVERSSVTFDQLEIQNESFTDDYIPEGLFNEIEPTEEYDEKAEEVKEEVKESLEVEQQEIEISDVQSEVDIVEPHVAAYKYPANGQYAMIRIDKDGTINVRGLNSPSTVKMTKDELKDYDWFEKSNTGKNAWQVLYKDGVPVKSLGNTQTINGVTSEFMSDEEYALLNNPNVSLIGKDIILSPIEDDVYGYKVRNAASMVVRMSVNINGREYTIGRLPSGNVPSLAALRKRLYEAFQKGETITDHGLKITGRSTGHFNRTKDNKVSPLESFPNATLSIVAPIKNEPNKYEHVFGQYENSSEILGSSHYSATSNQGYEGQLFMWLHSPNGFVPVRLYVNKASEIPGHKEAIEEILSKTYSSSESLQKALRPYVHAVVMINNGVISLQSRLKKGEDPTFTEYNDMTVLRDELLSRIARIDMGRINDPVYHKQLIEGNYLRPSDINPGQPFINANVIYNIPESQSTATPDKGTTVVADEQTIDLSSEDLRKAFGLEPVVSESKQEDNQTDSQQEDSTIKVDDKATRKTRLRVENNWQQYEKWDRSVEEAWFKKTYPNIPISVLDDLHMIHKINGLKAWGIFKNGAVYIASNAQKGTAYHEAFHAVFHTMLSSKEKLSLLSDMKKSYPNDTAIELEERLADDFMNYMIIRETKKGITDRIIRFFKKLLQLIKMVVAQQSGELQSFDDVFFRMAEGMYNNREPFFVKDVSRFKQSLLSQHEEDKFVSVFNGVLMTETLNKLIDTDKRFSKYKNLNPIDAIAKLIKDNKNEDNELILKLYTQTYLDMDNKHQDALQSGEMQVGSPQDILMRRRFESFATTEIVTEENGDITLKVKELDVNLLKKMYYGLKNFGITIKQAIDEEATVDELIFNQEQESLEDFNERTAMRDNFSKASPRFRALLSMIPVTKKYYNKGEYKGTRVVMDDSGLFPTFENGKVMFDNMKRALAGSSNREEMINRLKALAERKPSYEVVLDLVQVDNQFATEIHKIMSQQHRVNFISQSWGYDPDIKDSSANKNKLYILNATNNENSLKKMMDYSFSISGIMAQAETPGGQKGLDNAKKEIKEILKSYPFDRLKSPVNQFEIDTLIRLMNGLGLDVESEAIIDMVSDQTINKENNIRGTVIYKTMLSNVLDILDTIIDKKDPFRQDSWHKASKAISNIIKNVVKYSTSMITDSFRMDGKSMNSYVDNRFSLEYTQRLKDENYRKQLKRDPFYKDSMFIDDFATNDIIVEFFGDIKLQGESKHKQFSALTDRQFEIARMSAWLSGRSEEDILKNSEKSKFTRYMFPILSNSTQNAFLKYRSFTEFEVRERLLNTLYQEFNRIKSLQAIVNQTPQLAHDYKLWLDGKGPLPDVLYKSNIATNMLRNGMYLHLFPEMQKPITQLLRANSTVIKDENGLEARIPNDIDFKMFYTFEYEITSDSKEKKTMSIRNRLNELIDTMVASEIDNMIEDGILRINDKNKVVSQEPGFDKNMTTKEVLELYIMNQFYVGAQIVTTYGGDLAYYKNLKNKNEVDLTDLTKRIKQIWSPSIRLDVNSKHTDSVTGKEITVRKEYKNLYLKDVILPSSQDLKDFIAQAYRESGMPESEITDELKAFEGNSLTDAASFIDIFRLREIYLGSAQWTNAHDVAYNKMINGKPVTIEEAALITPVKPFVYDVVETAVRHIKDQIRYQPTQKKMAQFLLSPEFAKNHSKLRDMMSLMGYKFSQRNGEWQYDGFDLSSRKVDEITFDTALKVGMHSVTPNIETAMSKDFDMFVTLDNKDYGVQMSTPEHYIDAYSLFGTQVRGHMIADIDTESNEKYTVNGKQMTSQEIFDRYNFLISDNIKKSYEILMSEVTTNGSDDYRKLINSIKNDLRNDNVPEHIVSMLDLENFGANKIRTKGSLWLPQIQTAVERAITSRFKNKITKQKIRGVALYNASMFGMEENDEPKIVCDKKTKAVKYIECYMPAYDEGLMRFADANGVIDVKKIAQNKNYKHLLEGIVYRIPTEDKYSIFHIKVKGFLPNSMGGQIMLPREITTIAGLDFDIDKMYGMMYDSDSDMNKVTQDNIIGNNNELIDIMIGILSQPSSASHQMSKGGFDLLKDIAADVRDLRNTKKGKLNIMKPSYSRDTYVRMQMGNGLIGVHANHVKNETLMVHGGVVVDHGPTINGVKYNRFSMKPNKNNTYSSRAINQLRMWLASSVDHGKDPVQGEFNITMDTVDALDILIRLSTNDGKRITSKQAAYMFALPVMTDFVNRMKLSRGGVEEKYAIISNMKNEYRDNAPKQDAELTVENIRKVIKEPNTELAKSINYQMIKIFSELNEVSKDIQLISSQMRSDAQNNAAGPDASDVIVAIAKNEYVKGNNPFKFYSNKTSSNIKNQKVVFDKISWLEDFFEYGVDKAADMLKTVLYDQTGSSKTSWSPTEGVYAELHKILGEWKGGNQILNSSEIKQIDNAYKTYLTTGFDFFADEYRTVLKTMNKDIQDFIKTEAGKPYDGFLRLFKKTGNLIYFDRSGVSSDMMKMYVSNFSEMYNSSDAQTKKIADDIIRYAFFTSGFIYTGKNFYDVIDPMIWNNLRNSDGVTYRQYMEEAFSKTNKVDTEEINMFIRQLVQNASGNWTFLKNIDSKSVMKIGEDMYLPEKIVVYSQYENGEKENKIRRYLKRSVKDENGKYQIQVYEVKESTIEAQMVFYRITPIQMIGNMSDKVTFSYNAAQQRMNLEGKLAEVFKEPEAQEQPQPISSSTETNIYSQLGNKTKSENVVIDVVAGRKPAVESNLPTKDVKINIYAGANQNTELSNFAIRPFKTNVKTSSGTKEYTFQSVEQGFHFYKAVVANNPQVAAQILKTTNGGTLRNLTNRNNLKMTPEQVKEWDDTSKSIMLNLMYDSYAQNPDKAQLLLNTGEATITHTQDDTRWKTDFPEVVTTVRDMLREEGFDKNQSSKPIVAYRTRGNSKVELFNGFWTRDEVAKQTNKVFLFGDNTDDRLNTNYVPSSTQAVIRGLPNAIGIDTKKDRGTGNSSYFKDADFDVFKQQVDEAIKKAKDSGKIIVIPTDGIGTGKAMLKEKAPKLFRYLQQELDKLQKEESNFLEAFEKDNAIGNPWSHLGSGQSESLTKKNLFTVKPIQSVDKKAIVKASIATQYIGFGEGIANSSTELYRQQAGEYANTGNYSSNDVIFVSIGGRRGNETVRKEQQDKTIREALKAIENGATLITDNKSYVESSDYNEGEKRLAKNLEAKGYNYSEQTVDGQTLGVWNKNPSSKPIVNVVENKILDIIFAAGDDYFNNNQQLNITKFKNSLELQNVLNKYLTEETDEPIMSRLMTFIKNDSIKKEIKRRQCK